MSARFRLAPVLRLFQRIEDERALALAVALGRRDTAATRRDAAEEAFGEAGEALVTSGLAGVTGEQFRLMAATVQGAAAREAAARAALTEEETRVETARDFLTRAAQKRRALERLQAMHEAARATAQERAERARLDDVALIQHGRAAAEGDDA